MAHYALINDTSVVVDVITGRDEDEVVDGITDWEAYYSQVTGLTALRTSYNTHAGQHAFGGTPFRGNYAGIGFTYDEALDAFIPPQVFPSWVLDESNFQWVAPVPYPETGEWVWDEVAGVWVEVEDEAV